PLGPALRRDQAAYLARAPQRTAAPDEKSAPGGRVTSLDQTRVDPAREAALAQAQGRDIADDQARAERAAAERRHRRALLNLAIRVGSLATALALWEWAGSQINPVLFTTPSAVALAAVSMIASGELWTYLWPSLVVLGIGLTLAAIAGIGIGLLLARYWI